MVRQVNIAEAKAKLSELVEAASRGEEIVLARHGKPMARLVGPAAPRIENPRLGAMRARLTAKRIDALAKAIESPLPKPLQRAIEGGASDSLGVARRTRRSVGARTIMRPKR